LSEQFNHSCAGVRHIGKSRGNGEARNAGLGGVAWRASARSNLLIGKNPEDPRDRAIVQIKSNLLPEPESPHSLGYTITNEGLKWTGRSSLSAHQMLAFRQHETHQERSEREEAVEFLQTILRDGPVESNIIKKEAKVADISDATLRRAKSQLGVQAVKLGAGGWVWKLKFSKKV
jgi:putative DNA primase/helicase